MFRLIFKMYCSACERRAWKKDRLGESCRWSFAGVPCPGKMVVDVAKR